MNTHVSYAQVDTQEHYTLNPWAEASRLHSKYPFHGFWKSETLVNKTTDAQHGCCKKHLLYADIFSKKYGKNFSAKKLRMRSKYQ